MIMTYIIYLYYVLMVIYFYEYPKMFVTIGVNRFAKIGQLTAHSAMLLLSVLALYRYYRYSAICGMIWGDFFALFIIVALFGIMASFGAVFVLTRSYLTGKP